MNFRNKLAIATELSVLEGELKKRADYKFNRFFPDEGPLRRDLYRSAMAFFAGGARFPERLLLGGNRTGKTEAASFEAACHLTGYYPHWWVGKRFSHPVNMWVAGDTATTARDIIQLSLYGPVPSAPRTGMIPAHLIRHASPKNSIPGAVETIFVKHITGGDSSVQFKSYDQRREAFQGTEKHIIWLDEECPEDVYTECLLRTLTCSGIVMVTFTPVEGLTPFVQAWLEQAAMFDAEGDLLSAESQVFAPPDDSDLRDVVGEVITDLPVESRTKLIVMVSWDEVPHLTPAARQQMLQSIPPYQRDARTRGIPNLGSGVIYPIPEDEIKVRPFDIPVHWPRGYGLDVGWNWTVAVHGAYDRETATWYLYHEHFRSHAEPPVHAAAIKAMGAWINGKIDPAANGRSQADGKQLIQLYQNEGLLLDNASNGVESGIFELWTLLTQGRVKVFASLRHWFTEYRMYRRNAKGQVVKKNDHLMDATRYLTASGVEWLNTAPVAGSEHSGDSPHQYSWMS